MFKVKVEICSMDTELKIFEGFCHILPTEGCTFVLKVNKPGKTIEIDFGTVLNQREDYGIITFMTTEGVYDLEVLSKQREVEEPKSNVLSFDYYRRKKSGSKSALMVTKLMNNKPNELEDLKLKTKKIGILLSSLKSLAAEEKQQAEKDKKANKNNNLKLIVSSTKAFT